MATPLIDSVGTAQTSDSASSLTFAHTCTGNDRALYVGVSIRRNGTQTIDSVTYNAVALTKVVELINANDVIVTLWRLIAPATGANNVVVTLSAVAAIVACAISLTVVNQGTVERGTASAQAESGDASLSISSAVDDLVLDCLAVRAAPVVTVGAGQTERWNAKNAASNVRGAGSTEPGASSVTMSWTGIGANQWALVAVSILPAEAEEVYHRVMISQP